MTIGNAAPVVDSVTIDQSAPDTDDVLSVTVDASDDDGDTLTYDYQWTNGGVDIAGETGATLDLGVSGNGDRGDDIAVRVTASDAGSTSDAVTSAAVTVANSAPVVTSVSIDQSTVHTNGTLTATVTGDDLDGDGLGIDYQWLANGSPISGATELEPRPVPGRQRRRRRRDPRARDRGRRRPDLGTGNERPDHGVELGAERDGRAVGRRAGHRRHAHGDRDGRR